jgi:hypothetical protein
MGLNVKVGLDGSGFTVGIGKVNEQLAYAKAQFKEASSSLGVFGDSMAQLQVKAQYLTAQMTIQQGKVDALQAEYATAAAATDADAEATQRLATKLLTAQGVLNNMRNSLAETSASIDEMGAASTETAVVTEDAALGMEDATVSAEGFAGGLLKTLGPMAAMFGIYEGGKAVITDGIAETNQYNAAQAQLTNQLKTSGDAIGMTPKQLDALATSTAKGTAISDAMNLTAESTLLNFSEISKSTLPAATQAVDDLATKMAVAKGQAVPSLAQITTAAKEVGKAMEDPTTGTTAFTRAMVTFSPAQVEAIKNLQKHGNTAGAAALLMKDLSSVTAGAATSAATTYSGKVAELKKQMDEFSGQAVVKCEAMLTSLGETVVNVTMWFEQHKGVLSLVEGVVITITAAFLAYKTIQLVSAAATGIATAAQWLLNGAMIANPIGLIVVGIGILIAAVVLIATHWQQVSSVLSTVWKDIKGGFVDFINFIIGGLNQLIAFELLPFNFVIKGLDMIPGVKIPELKLTIPNIPKFDVGTNYVPNDMLAMVHRGEMIVPKAQNPYAGGGKSQGSQSSGDMVFNFDLGNGVVKTIKLTSQQIASQNRTRSGFKAVIA